MQAKKCSKCSQVKSLSEFNTRTDRPSSYRSECKRCQYDAQYKRALQNRHKIRAKDRARIAENKGILKRPNYCMCCHEIRKLIKHHPDYSDPYYVLWVCRKCHGEIHSIQGSYSKAG